MFVLVLAFLLPAASARANTVQVPEGGGPVPVVPRGVVCGPAPVGWTIGAENRFVRPPAPDEVGPRVAEVKVAADQAACSRSTNGVTLIATGQFPEIDLASVAFFPDEGRLEMKGQHLKGLQIRWQTPQKSGQDVCLDPQPSGKQEQCVVPVGRDLPGDTNLRWMPSRARFDADVVTYDENGTLVDANGFVLRPARVVISNMFPASGSVDVSQGPGRVALVHPETVISVDCGQARCELAEGAVAVRSFSPIATTVTVRLRLGPRFFLTHGTAQEQVVTATLPLLHCPLAVVSGPPLRDGDATQVIVRMDARCVSGTRLRWLTDGRPADVLRTEKSSDATFFLLATGRVVSERVTIAVTRADLDGTVIGVVETATIPAPRPRVTLELPKHGPIDFIPTNRDAVLTVVGAGEHARFVPLAVEGAYAVTPAPDHRSYLVRGEPGVTGFVSLRFGYRPDGLPSEFAGASLATLEDPVQRVLREANVPAPFSTSASGDNALIELVCADAQGKPHRLEPGKENVIPFAERSTCRVLIHRERLRPEDGQQEVVLDVDVTAADGSARGSAGLHERMVLRPGGDVRVIPLKGGTRQFDHIVVRMAHVLDETRYTLGPLTSDGLPAVQWSVTIEGGRARLYGTVSIPAGLYRMTSPSGQLTLNFGVLSRIVKLDRRGKESLLGLELGLMGMGLLQPANTTPYPATLGAVAGVGIRLPLGGSDTAIAIHMWGVYEFRGRYAPDPSSPNADASHWAIIFGPSVSIGNVGANL